MRTAETVFAVLRERGTRELPLEDLYRQLFNRELYLRAYGRVSRRDGAMTPGTTPRTVARMIVLATRSTVPLASPVTWSRDPLDCAPQAHNQFARLSRMGGAVCLFDACGAGEAVGRVG